MTYTLHYVSADGPGLDATWSVYREEYVSVHHDAPIDGTQEFVSQHPSEEAARVESRRLQALVSRQASPLRAAIEAMLGGPVEQSGVHIYLGNEGEMGQLIDALVEAVERVPVSVTIRDLDMSPENVLVVEGDAIRDLGLACAEAHTNGLPLYVTVDRGAIKTKLPYMAWSAPIETQEYEG